MWFNIYTGSLHKYHKEERDNSKDICTTNLGQVGNNFTSFNSCIVIFIDQQRLNNHKDLQESLHCLILDSYEKRKAKICILFCILPPFSLICNFEKQNTCRNVSKISVSLACYRQIGSKSTNRSH